MRQACINKLIPRGCAPSGTKNRHLWGKLKDYLAFGSQIGYSLCLFKTIIELELMYSTQSNRNQDFLVAVQRVTHLVTADPKCVGSADKIALFSGGKGQHSEHVHVSYFGLSSPTWVYPHYRTMKVEETERCIH